MGNICPGTPIPGVPREILGDITNAVGALVINIPLDYAKEKERIVTEMQEAAPEPYENLLFSDYPDKNGSKVHEMAIKNAILENAKNQIVDEVNQQIKQKLDAIPNMPDFVREAIYKAIEETVNKAIDTVIKQIEQNRKNK